MKDFLLNDEGDITISNNDLLIGVSDQQNQQRLLLTDKGTIKQYVDAGVGAIKYLENEDPAGLLREIGIQFSADGMKVKNVSLVSGNILIDAPYE